MLEPIRIGVIMLFRMKTQRYPCFSRKHHQIKHRKVSNAGNIVLVSRTRPVASVQTLAQVGLTLYWQPIINLFIQVFLRSWRNCVKLLAIKELALAFSKCSSPLSSKSWLLMLVSVSLNALRSCKIHFIRSTKNNQIRNVLTYCTEYHASENFFSFYG